MCFVFAYFSLFFLDGLKRFCVAGANVTEVLRLADGSAAEIASLERYPASGQAIYWVLGLFTITLVFGIFCNAVAICVYFFYADQNKCHNLYHLNLAIADLCSLIGIPFLMATMIMRSWPFGSVMCKAFVISSSISQFASITLVVITSVDVYFVVCHPISSVRLRTPLVSQRVSAAVWAASVLMTLPVYMVLIPTDQNSTSCNIVWPNYDDRSQVSLTSSNLGVFYSTPRVISIVFYFLAGRGLHSGPMPMSAGKRRSLRMINRLGVTIIVCYVMGWMLFCTLKLVLAYFPSNSTRIDYCTVFLSAAWVGYLGSTLNSVFYSFMSKTFTKSLKKGYLDIVRRWRPGYRGGEAVVERLELAHVPGAQSQTRLRPASSCDLWHTDV